MASYPYALTVTNPGAETGNATGWTNVTGTLAALANGTGGRNGHSGSYFFHAGSTATAECYQDVTLPADVLADVDANLVRVNFSGYHQGADTDADSGQLALKFYNGSNALIGGERILLPHDGALGAWVLQTLRALVPPLTRKIRITLKGTRAAGVSLDSYWDDLTLTLESAPVAYTVPGCEYWLKGEDVAEADGVEVSNWPEATGTTAGPTATLTTRPLSRPGGTSGLNAQPSVQADGSNDVMRDADAGLFQGSPGLTIFAAVHHEFTFGVTNGDIIGRDGATRGYRLSINAYGQPFVQISISSSTRVGRAAPTVKAMGCPFLVRSRFNGAAGELTLAVNGVRDDTGSLDGSVPAVVGNNGPSLGVFGCNTERFKGHIAEVLMFGRALTDDECATIEAALLTKYALLSFTPGTNSSDMNVHSGVASDPTHRYLFHTTRIDKRLTADESLVTQNTSPFTGLATGTNHLADGDYYNGYLYVHCCNSTDLAQPKYILKFRADTLERVAAVETDYNPSAVCVDPERGLIWGVDYDTAPVTLRKYDLATLAYIGAVATDFTLSTYTQGIAFRAGRLWVQFGTETTTEGLLCSFDRDTGAHRPMYRPYMTGAFYCEGCDFRDEYLLLEDDGASEIVHAWAVTGLPAPPVAGASFPALFLAP